jgi:hypothetical protein
MDQFKQIKHFEGSRNARGQQARVEDTRAAAEHFRKDFLGGGKVKYFQSFDLVTVPYPSRYGLRNAFSRERFVEFMHLRNRMFVVQFETSEGLKTLLVSPSDHEYNIETPFFRRLADVTPAVVSNYIVKRHGTVPEILARIGLRPEDVVRVSQKTRCIVLKDQFSWARASHLFTHRGIPRGITPS